jgi:acetoin utilization deacetylase AcuC-like enzyme
MTLEGGYNLTGLRDSIRAVLKELMGESILTESDLKALEQGPAPAIINEVIQVQRSYWPF